MDILILRSALGMCLRLRWYFTWRIGGEGGIERGRGMGRVWVEGEVYGEGVGEEGAGEGVNKIVSWRVRAVYRAV